MQLTTNTTLYKHVLANSRTNTKNIPPQMMIGAKYLKKITDARKFFTITVC